MRKIFVFFVFLTMGGLVTTFGQLKVTNNSGQELTVTINGQKAVMPYKTAKTFQARGRNVWVEAIASGKKFSIEKTVPRSGSISIESSDISASSASTQSTPASNVGSAGSTESNAVPIGEAPNTSVSSTANPLRSSRVSNTTSNAVPASVPSSNAVSASSVAALPASNNQPVIKGEKTTIIYKGSDRFKIFSEIGRGLEFCGADSLNKDDNAKNSYVMVISKNKDLVIGIGIKESDDPSIWPYAEIRKRVNSWDQTCIINGADVKKMSTDKKKAVRIKLLAPGKIYFEPGTEASERDKEPISIGTKETSRLLNVPIGLFFIRLVHTDVTGMFKRTVFIPIHITDKDRYLEITEANLKGAINESDISNPPAW